MVLVHPVDGKLRGRPINTLARRLGLRRLITQSRQAGRFVSLTLLVGLLAILAECFMSYSFFVYEADIRGNHLLSYEVLYEASGIDGYSIFWIDPKAVEASLEALPYVREARVRSWLPNRVEITIQEREPMLLWRTKGKALWADWDGVTMEPIRDLPGLIRLEDELAEAVGPDGHLDPNIILGIRGIRQLLPEVDLFYYNRLNGLHFTTPDGVEVRLGDGQDMAYKVQLFDAIRRQARIEGRSVHLIDVRYPESPFIR
jgi:cell division septal protein FtsQ